MKTVKNWQLVKMSYNDPRGKGFYNLPYVLVYNDNDTIAPCGSTDNVSLFQKGNDLVFLSSNSLYGYVGINIYDNELNETAELFFQDMDELCDLIGVSVGKFFDYSYLYQAKILYNLL